MTLYERIDAKIQPEPMSGCWLWDGVTSGPGYASVREGGKGSPMVYVHRVQYERHKGPIPEGQEVDHLCRTRTCVNPAHLEAVPHQVNMLRAGPHRPKRYDVGPVCRSGHDRSEHGFINSQGRQACRLCQTEAQRRYAARTRR